MSSETLSSSNTKGKTFDVDNTSIFSGYISTCPVGYFSLYVSGGLLETLPETLITYSDLTCSNTL